MIDISIFTVGSVTTADDKGLDADIMREYFRGIFRSMALFAEDIEEYGNVNMHILSREYGYVRGDEKVEMVENQEDSVDLMQDALLQAATTSDVIVVAFMNEEYDQIVRPIRDEIFNNASNDQIWGFSAPKTVQRWLNPGELEELGCDVIMYDKVGPALVSTDFKDKVKESVINKKI